MSPETTEGGDLAMSTHHPSTTALTEDTGEQQIISTGPTRAELRGRAVAGPVRRGGWALLASAAVAAGYYALTTGSAPRPITGLLLAGVVTLAVLGGGCLIGGWGVRVIVTEAHRVGCRLRREISTQVAEDLEAQIDRCTGQVQAELAELRQMLTDHATAASIVAQASNGSGPVRPLHPGRPGPREGS